MIELTPARRPSQGYRTDERKESDCYGGVEELFVACRFEEASRRAADLLLQEEKMESKVRRSP